MIPWFQFATVSLGPLTLQVWGFFVALGMVVSMLILYHKMKDRGVKEAQEVVDLAIRMIVSGLLFARGFHILFYDPTFFFANPLEIVKVWHGGLSSFGGLFGAVLVFVLWYKKRQMKGTVLLQYADLFSFAALYGWIVGRIGCFMIHDHLGKPCPDCILALNTPSGPRLEMALLEIIGLLPLAVIFYISRKKQKSSGWFVAILFMYYGVLRFVLDFFRATDIAQADARYVGLTPAQYFAILLVFVGGFLYKKNCLKK